MSKPNLEIYGTVALVIDASQSAVSYWGETRRAALELYVMLSRSGEVALGLLGQSESIKVADLESLSPPPIQPCSLIAPSLEKFVQQRPIQAVIIVGNGKVFDIEDWIEHPLIERWLLIQSGPDSLQGELRSLPEITSSELDRAVQLLTRPLPQRNRTEPSSRRLGNVKTQRWSVDPTGYPLILIEPLQSWIQLFPVTKTQFERFLATTDQAGFDDEWYTTVLKLNPRVSFRSPTPEHYERLLITGVTRDETMSFGRWLGNDYLLLEKDEWRMCYRWLASQPVTALPLELGNRLAADARAIWRLIEERLQPRTLLELSLMSQGVIEWVLDQPKTHAGLGDPRPSSPFSPPLREWFNLVKPIVQRPRDFGFRLHTKRV